MKKLLVTVSVFLIGALSFFTMPVMAADQTDEKPSPMFGLSRGETARFNLVNTGENNLSCEGNLMIFDGDGSVIVEQRWVLGGGQSTFVDVPFSILGRTDNRAEIRGFIIYGNNLRKCFKAVLPSAETFDDVTQTTDVIVKW